MQDEDERLFGVKDPDGDINHTTIHTSILGCKRKFLLHEGYDISLTTKTEVRNIWKMRYEPKGYEIVEITLGEVDNGE